MDEKKKQLPALVTGASSGIGKAIALKLIQAGIPTWASARRLETLQELKEAGCRVIQLDVTDEESRKNAVAEIEKEHGAIGYLINNAGYEQTGPVEEVSLDAARAQFEVNVFGLMRMTQLVLPGMRDKGFGRIINISSIGTLFSAPMVGVYHATKYAVEALSDSLRMEVRPFGIDVIDIQPPGVRTRFISTGNDLLPKTGDNSPYAEGKAAFEEKTKKMTSDLIEPEDVAEKVLRAVQDKRPRPAYKVGFVTQLTNMMRRFMPKRSFDSLVERKFRDCVPKQA